MGGSSAWSYLTDYLPWELGSSVGESHMMAAAEARGIWQRTAAKCHLVQEDSIRSPKLVHCQLPSIVSRSPADTCHPVGYSYYWSNNWGSVDPRISPETKLDLQWQFSPGTTRDYRSEGSALHEIENARFPKPAGLQSLAAESNLFMNSGAGLIATASDYTPAELELEWQFIGDQQSKPGLADPLYDTEIFKADEEGTFAECNKKHDRLARLQEVHTCDVGTHGIARTSCSDGGPSRTNYGTCLSRQSKLGVSACQEISGSEDLSSRSSIKGSLLWQVAEKEILAGLVPQQAPDRVENCDLPCPQERLIPKAGTKSFDDSPSIQNEDVSQTLDKEVLFSLDCGSGPALSERVGLFAPSPVLGEMNSRSATTSQSQRITEPLIVPCTKVLPSRHGSHSFSASNRKSRINRRETFTLDQGSGLLGEALCHSQTRAREAERKVQRVYAEKEQLMQLFFKEASLAFTYRQWVTSLQMENMWLRMSPHHKPVAWLQHSIFNPFSALERLSSKRSKSFSQDCHAQYHIDQNVSAIWHEKGIVYLADPNDVMMGCTLAFALGLSLAGAGLMLGWSMGWILLAY